MTYEMETTASYTKDNNTDVMKSPDIKQQNQRIDKVDENCDVAKATSVDVAPDGGWGWIVCIACLSSHVFTHGVLYSFGVIFVDLLEYFGHGKGDTAWISSLANGTCFLSGPLTAILVNQLGCRYVAIIGALVLSGSLIISSFAPNIYFLYFSFGILTGTGVGLVYLSSVICVTMYFKKKRSLATGIGVSGAGIGTFILGPLINYFLHEYGWRGSIILIGGISLNSLPCALLYRPLSKNMQTVPRTRGTQDDLQSVTLLPKQSDHGSIANDFAKPVDKTNDTTDMLLNIPDKQICQYNNTKHGNEDIVFQDGQMIGIRNRSTNGIHNIDSSHASIYIVGANNIDHRKGKPLKEEILDNIKRSLDLEMFKNIPFTLFLISVSLYCFGYYIPYIYLPDTAKQAGLNQEQGAWLIATVGITNTTGRIIIGAIADRRCVNRLMLYTCALISCGVATSLGPFFVSFPSLLLYAVIFGFSSGVTISLTSVIVVDIVGIQKFPGAIGLINFFSGIAMITGLPFAGWLFDVSGSYVLTYVIGGLSISLSGAMLFVIPCLRAGNQDETELECTNVSL